MVRRLLKALLNMASKNTPAMRERNVAVEVTNDLYRDLLHISPFIFGSFGSCYQIEIPERI